MMPPVYSILRLSLPLNAGKTRLRQSRRRCEALLRNAGAFYQIGGKDLKANPHRALQV
jgi:hypothetical protein